MASTPKGFPYPVGTDRVMDGDNAIQALATAMDPWACSASGTVLITLSTANVAVSGTVTFPVGRFTAAPQVIAMPVVNTAQYYACGATGASTAGATIWANRAVAGGATNVYWVAVQSPA